MTTSATIDLAELADSLRGMGYDIEPEKPERGRPAGSAIVARRDLGERVVLLAIDQAGRFRADLSWLVGEWPAQITLGSTSFRSVDRVSREVTLTGQVLPIGGVKEKSLAAQRAGIKLVILPGRNEGDVEEIPEDERAVVEFRYAEKVGDALAVALEGNLKK